MKVEFKNLEDMVTINKNDYPDVFIENEEMCDEDIQLFKSILGNEMPKKERVFFEKMKDKVANEFAPSADIMMQEDDNEEGLYLIRYYFSEFKIGKRGSEEALYCITFAQVVNQDLLTLLGRHITLLEWLREIDFKPINYNGNCILNRH